MKPSGKGNTFFQRVKWAGIIIGLTMLASTLAGVPIDTHGWYWWIPIALLIIGGVGTIAIKLHKILPP